MIVFLASPAQGIICLRFCRTVVEVIDTAARSIAAPGFLAQMVIEYLAMLYRDHSACR